MNKDETTKTLIYIVNSLNKIKVAKTVTKDKRQIDFTQATVINTIIYKSCNINMKVYA